MDEHIEGALEDPTMAQVRERGGGKSLGRIRA
ncbi:Protein of unknown function [Pyronema omphalodes CBS 100304]|uniref:Uncharacterized protein n=1 Tax=Pyronema omphalodes (strain CBS 100304) TaxID=1076935 RepID=U4L6Q3_PYROM|nr:Protein of unknown function [Pyronema omphalodes CBS 100304]